MPAPRVSKIAVVIAALCGAPLAHAQTMLLQEDFSTPALDTAKWSVADWNLGRTHMSLAPTLANGVATLRFETFDAAQPGTAFAGTELYSNQLFNRGAGLEFSARMRFANLPDGLVPAFFTFANPGGAGTHEIDFEFLTSQTNPAGANVPVALTSWRNWKEADGFGQSNSHWSTTATLTNFNHAAFNTYTARWLPNRTEWYVNGNLVASTNQAVPDAPMAVHLNLWAPGATWPEAFSAALQPATAAEANQRWFMEVDSVSVSAVPEPGETALLAAGLAVLAGVVRRRRAPTESFEPGAA